MTVHPGPGQSRLSFHPPLFVVVAGVIFSFTCEVVGSAAAARQDVVMLGRKKVFIVWAAASALPCNDATSAESPPCLPYPVCVFCPGGGWVCMGEWWKRGCVCAPSSRPNLLDIVGRKEKESLCVLCMWTPLSFKQSTDRNGLTWTAPLMPTHSVILNCWCNSLPASSPSLCCVLYSRRNCSWILLINQLQRSNICSCADVNWRHSREAGGPTKGKKNKRKTCSHLSSAELEVLICLFLYDPAFLIY